MAANSLVNPTWVMKQIGLRLVNNMRFANQVDRSYSDEFKQSGAKVGYTVNARLPQRYQVNKGQALNAQPIIDNVVPITLTDQANIGLEFSMASLTMEVDNYREKCIEPAVDALINQVDYDGLSRMYKKVANTVGTPAVVPGSTGTLPGAANIVYQKAVVKLANYGVSTSALKAMLSPNMHAYLSSANFALFNPAAAISKMYKTGQFSGEALGISEWFMDQNVATHTVGPLGTTPQIDGVPTEGSASILTKGWTASAAKRLNEGDVVQFAGCYDINSLNYQANADLKDFVVTANVTGTGGGAATIPISPAMITSGAWATCSALPADSAAVTIFGHASSYANAVTPQGLIYAPGAFALVFADLEKPGGLWVAERISNRALGIAVRFLKDYAIMTDQSPARVDLMYGWAAVRPEFAVRVCS
ncbi:MAG: hypothetical protein NTY02_03405 [Acidobacteria bacterium]|nr:hypothetical protein [Acidobacteriota bacterium]